MSHGQCADTILMVRPAAFGSNPETLASNAFQLPGTEAPPDLIRLAQSEFDNAVAMVRAEGVRVIVVEDTPEPAKPDAVFPNNWISFHEDGRVAIYPLLSPIRRLERRLEIVDALRNQFLISEVVDYSPYEHGDAILEGTGSLVLDRVCRIAYACLSERTDADLVDVFCREFGYRPHVIRAVDGNGLPIYHTNVMMAIGTRQAVVCLDSIRSGEERENLLSAFRSGGKDVVAISVEQMNNFAGNALEVWAGAPRWVISKRGYESLDQQQRMGLARLAEPIIIPLGVIERFGGGSIRCMMAEVLLPKR